jgi:hypothetical protein
MKNIKLSVSHGFYYEEENDTPPGHQTVIEWL